MTKGGQTVCCGTPSTRTLPPLPGAMASVNPQVGPGHEAAGITEQKHSRPAILFRIAQPPKHVGIRPSRPPLRHGFKEALGHGCDDIPRGDCVYADAMHAPLRREAASELHDCGLGCVVRPASRQQQKINVTHATREGKPTGKSAPCSPPSRSCSQSAPDSPSACAQSSPSPPPAPSSAPPSR